MRPFIHRVRWLLWGLLAAVLGVVLYAQEPQVVQRGMVFVRGGVTFLGTTGNSIIAEGATADANETTLIFEDPTADRSHTVPNIASSTFVVLAGAQTLTDKTLTAPTITNPTVSGQTPVDVTGATVTLGTTHVGRLVTLNRAAGIAVTLPAATGTGSVYTLHVGTTFTGASTVKVNATPGTDVMQGTAALFADGGDTVVGFATAATADTIDMLGTANSTGGIFGERIDLIDSASGIWSVRIVSDAGGTEATPFSATVP